MKSSSWKDDVLGKGVYNGLLEIALARVGKIVGTAGCRVERCAVKHFE
jgi:hypothetical protein